MTMINQKDALNIAGDGIYSDEFELTITPSFPSDSIVSSTYYQNIVARVMQSDLPVRNTNAQKSSLRGMPIIRRGRVQYDGQSNLVFVESLGSDVDAFIQHWYDCYEYDSTGSKSLIKACMLNFTLTQYKPDRSSISRIRRMYYCLPVTGNSIDGGHSEQSPDIARTSLSVMYMTSRTGLKESDLTLLDKYYRN